VDAAPLLTLPLH